MLHPSLSSSTHITCYYTTLHYHTSSLIPHPSTLPLTCYVAYMYMYMYLCHAGVVLREARVLQRAPAELFDCFRQSLLASLLSETLPFVRRQIAHAGIATVL